MGVAGENCRSAIPNFAFRNPHSMNPEHIEKLKREYTDKYVAVDGSRPELARFKDVVGQVRTVNMSGRALVEFFDYHLNIGWYDIDVDFLKLVEKPEPKAKESVKAKDAAKKPLKAAPKAAAPEAEKKLSPLEMARAMDAKKKGGGAVPAKPAASKMSTADVLAAARGAQATKAEAAAEKPKPSADPKKMSTADILAAARGAKAEAAPRSEAPPPAVKPQPAAEAKPPAETPKADRSKLSTADILAMARSEKAAAKSPATVTAEAPATVAPAADVTVASQTSEEAPEVTPPPKSSSERVDRSKMSVDEMIAWCRAHDSK